MHPSNKRLSLTAGVAAQTGFPTWTAAEVAAAVRNRGSHPQFAELAAMIEQNGLSGAKLVRACDGVTQLVDLLKQALSERSAGATIPPLRVVILSKLFTDLWLDAAREAALRPATAAPRAGAAPAAPETPGAPTTPEGDDADADAEDADYPPIRDEDKRSLRCRDGAFLPIVVYDTKSGMTALISLFKNGQPIKEPHEGGRDSWRVFEKTIGQGNYGDVAIVINVRRGRRSEALKSVRLQGKTEAERRAEQSNLIDEARNMLRVGGHTNVLQVLGVFLWSNEVLTFSELVENGRELTDIIQGGELVARAAADDDVAAAERAALQRVLTLALQLARGLGHIHSRCVLHNDVRVVVAAARPANGGGGDS